MGVSEWMRERKFLDTAYDADKWVILGRGRGRRERSDSRGGDGKRREQSVDWCTGGCNNGWLC